MNVEENCTIKKFNDRPLHLPPFVHSSGHDSTPVSAKSQIAINLSYLSTSKSIITSSYYASDCARASF